MKLRVFLCLVAIAVVSSGANAGNTFPFPDVRAGIFDGVGNSGVPKLLYKGFFEGQQAWFIKIPDQLMATPCIDLDYRFRYPKLASAIGSGAPFVYQVLNFQQGPVFSSRPGDNGYSGIWQVVYITWKKGVPKRPIISASDLPPMSDADYTSTGIVVDRPIIAIGDLVGAHFSENDGTYFLPQVQEFATRPAPVVLLPVWYVYGQDPVTKKIVLGFVTITDIGDPDLAALFKANYAPGLNDIDPDNVQSFWAQDWRVLPPPPPWQFPVVDEIDYLLKLSPPRPQFVHNFNYSPVKDLTLYTRTTAPPYPVIESPALLQQLLADTALEPTGPPVRINAPMLESVPRNLVFDGDGI